METLKKTLYFFAICCFVMLAFLFVSNLLLNRIGFTKESLEKEIPFQQKHERTIPDGFNKLSSEILQSSQNLQPLNRNIFTEKIFVIEKPKFVLLEAKQNEYPVIFKGSLTRGDNTVIGQINLNNKTYFVKPGENIQGWVTESINKDTITIRTPEKELLTLELNKTHFSDEMTAKIKITALDQTRWVSPNDLIEGYTILEITKNYVMMSNTFEKLKVVKE